MPLLLSALGRRRRRCLCSGVFRSHAPPTAMVFFLEDLLTGDTAHRGVVEEEDEARATEIAPQYDAAPEVHWAEGATSPSHPSVVSLQRTSRLGVPL